MKKWLYIRLGLMLGGFVSGIVSAEDFLPETMGWVDFVAMFCGSCFGLLFIIGIQAINPFSDAVWEKPAWGLNPFNLKQMLQSFHLMSMIMLATGVGVFLSAPFTSNHEWYYCIVPLVFGCGLWCGIALCTFVFRKKMAKHTSPEPNAEPEE